MSKYSKKYQKIVDELIRESFPELKKIRVFELKFTKLHGIYLPLLNWVGINSLCREFPEKEIRGILAHELCHVVLAKCKNFKYLFLSFAYWFSSNIRKREEDMADKLTIEKGYARDLVLSAKRLEKLYPEYTGKTFMSANDIRNYALKLGKW